jgi:hypothetical protein
MSNDQTNIVPGHGALAKKAVAREADLTYEAKKAFRLCFCRTTTLTVLARIFAALPVDGADPIGQP